MAAARAPVTRQVLGGVEWAEPRDNEPGQPLAPAVAELPVLDAAGRPLRFGELFRTRRAVVVFVRVSRRRAGCLPGHARPCPLGTGPPRALPLPRPDCDPKTPGFWLSLGGEACFRSQS